VGLNKGGAAVSFKLDETHLAFVSSHLAAHQSKTAQRNADVGEICANLKLQPQRQRQRRSAHKPDVATGFHHLVWLGDLNYRLEYGQQVRRRVTTIRVKSFNPLNKGLHTYFSVCCSLGVAPGVRSASFTHIRSIRHTQLSM
jgi:hypothetical protein